MTDDQSIINRIAKAHIAGQFEGEAAERKRIVKILKQWRSHYRNSQSEIALHLAISQIEANKND